MIDPALITDMAFLVSTVFELKGRRAYNNVPKDDVGGTWNQIDGHFSFRTNDLSAHIVSVCLCARAIIVCDFAIPEFEYADSVIDVVCCSKFGMVL